MPDNWWAMAPRGRRAISPPPRPRPRGASQRSRPLREQMDAWRSHHLFSAADSARRLAKTPWQTAATALMLAIALALPALFWLGFVNLQRVGQHLDIAPSVTAFTADGVRPEAMATYLGTLEARLDVASTTYLSPDEALVEFRRQTGFGDVLDSLPDNPLPGTLIVEPRPATADVAARLRDYMAQSPLFDTVQLDSAWLERLNAILALSERGAMAFGALLCLGALLVVGNTIGLAMENRRDEIIVTKMVGATAQYVQRPFLYSGAITGALGGVGAALLVALGQWLLAPKIDLLVNAYSSGYRLEAMGASGAVFLLTAGAALGWLGAQLAVWRHLWQIEP